MNFAASVEYDGSHFHGWQRQQNVRSVQQVVEEAISKVANENVIVTCSGRTDSGVHALNQVISFSSEANRTEKAWLLGVNTNLPFDVSLNWLVPTLSDFNARYNATRRHYRYLLYQSKARSALYHRKAYWVHFPLDVEAMRKGATHLIGEHDFTSFRSAQCQANHANRFLEKIEITQEGKFIYIDVIGNAFLHNMVRIIVGTMVKVGCGDQTPEWVKFLLEARDRKLGPKTAPSHGLYFISPQYPRKYNLPEFNRYPEL